MGIKTLLPFLKEVTEETNVQSFEGLVAAVDASCWLHKAICLSYQQHGDDRRVQDICSSYLDLLQRNNITPLIVFDGLPLPGKKDEHEKRARLRAENKNKAEILYRRGMVAEGNKLLAAASGVEHSMVLGFIEICRQRNINYVVAPYEADAELAFLLKQGHADFVISEDSDLLAYGCEKVLFKLKLNGQCQLIDLDKTLQHLQLSQENFLDMCIVAGCDYLDNVRGIGINKARKLISDGSNFLSVLQGMSHAPKEYSSDFLKAKAIFLHQTVIDPLNGTTVPLTRWEDTPNFQKTEEYQIICGNILFREYGVNLAIGNVNPLDSNTVNSTFQLPSKEGLWQEKDMTMSVTSLGGKTDWTIPSFPVLTLKFIKASVSVRGSQLDALFKAEDEVRLEPGIKIISSKWCYISIEHTRYLVAWEFREESTAALHQPAQTENVNTSSDENASGDDRDHTLPFKVLGVQFKQRQRHLEAAFQKLENGEEVSVDIKPEPDNDYDSNAIAVLLNYGTGWYTVGYIAKELTNDIHPLLETANIKVAISHIRFRVTYLLTGFYLTLNITRKGQWSPRVISASKKVQQILKD